MADPATGADLDAGRSRRMRWVWVGVALAVLVGLAWYVTHPPDLRGSAAGSLRTTPGDAVYLGVAHLVEDGESVLIRGVEVDASPEKATVRPLVCRSGSIGTTTRPAVFCAGVVPAVGSTLRSGDQLVLAVSGTAGKISLEGVSVSYRSGLQLGSQDIDLSVTVRVVEPGSSS